MDTNINIPSLILVFSGKRKSGKDYVADLLQKRIGCERCSILRLSAPLKAQYAEDHNLDFDRLLDASEYKEKYRNDMIKWGEDQRRRDPGFFCRAVALGPGSEKPVWLISDARRITDVMYFKDHFSEVTVRTVRVEASQEMRTHRGWVSTPGVDDAESECGLDAGVTFDHVIQNNGNDVELNNILDALTREIEEVLKNAKVTG